MTTATSMDALAIRRRLGRADWAVPEPFGPDGWSYRSLHGRGHVIVSCATWDGGEEWLHASITRPRALPTYDDLLLLRTAVWGEHGWAYQVFAPPAAHVNLHPRALHLWGRLDGAPVLPNFGAHGTI